MKQSRLMSLVEAIANVVIGFAIAVLTQLIAFPWFGLATRLSDALAIGGIFTVVSIIRSFALRRIFEALQVRGLDAAYQRPHTPSRIRISPTSSPENASAQVPTSRS